MTMTRRSVLSGIGATSFLAACGGEDGSGALSPAPAPPAAPVPTPTPTPPPVSAVRSVLTLGMSVFLGADLVGGNYPDRAAFMQARAPVRYFVDRLEALRGPGAGGTISEVNRAVGGSFDNDTPSQYAEVAGQSFDLVFLGLAMNSGSAYGVHGRGPNADYTRSILRDLIQQIKKDGARPVLCNTIHPWPEKITPVSINSALQEGVAWPASSATLYQRVPLRFDQGANDLIARDGSFSTGPGRFLSAGSQLRVLSGGGLNDGRTLRVAERLSPERLRIEAGDIQQSGDLDAFVQHYAPDLEPVLDPPPSRQTQRRDWNGSGVAVDGIASYRVWNAMLQELCAETDILLLDMEYRGFAWVEKRGWESVYTSVYAGERFETFNHPQLEAQSAIYGGLMRHLAELAHQNALPQGYAVLRGPDVHAMTGS